MQKLCFAMLTFGLALLNAQQLSSMAGQRPSNPSADKALLEAANNRDIEASKRALDAGADINTFVNAADANPNVVDGHGETPLMIAAIYNHIPLVNFLLHNGADVNRLDINGNTALITAVARNHTEVVDLLLHNGAGVNNANNAGDTALHYAAHNNNPEMVTALINNGARSNPLNRDGDTPLLSAVRQNHLEVVRLLLERVGDIYHINEQGATAFTVARDNNNTLIMRLLLEYGIEIPQPHTTALLTTLFDNNQLIIAIIQGDIVQVTELLNAIPPATIQQNLMNQGQPQHQAQSWGSAILNWAIPSHPLPQPLLVNYPHINQQDAQGMTPLHRAAAQGHDNIVRILLEHGADFTLTNNNRLTAQELATNNMLAAIDQATIDRLQSVINTIMLHIQRQEAGSTSTFISYFGHTGS
jgi:ankyrin repeat protein